MSTGSPAESTEVRLLVVGMGNVLRSDDGVGVHVVRQLAQEQIPPGVATMDIGIRGHALFDLAGDVPAVLIVDAARMGLEPGSARAFGPESLTENEGSGALSVHSVSFTEILQLADLQGVRSRIRFLGVEPASVEYGLQMSPTVQIRLDDIVRKTLTEVDSMLKDAANGR